ncbi:MAG: sigma-70 family RNA polymerase sigma factor [Actinobacteria bacterium]|nr:sigma-70 family RNA polymerase sigma factor [Actinomycetota bacterium]
MIALLDRPAGGRPTAANRDGRSQIPAADRTATVSREQDRSDEDLVAEKRFDRSTAAFGEFYARYEPAVLAYHRRRVGLPEVAADLTAETFARALAGRARFRPSKGSAAGWIFGIAHHVLVDSARRGTVEQKARERLGMMPLVLDDEDLARVDRLGENDRLYAALDALPEEQRTAIVARYVEDETYDETAERLRTSPAVVRKRASRGLARLRDQMRGWA